MANAIFLTNPELNTDNVTVTPSTGALGRRAGAPIAAAGNSGLLRLAAMGDAGDDLSHVVGILGSQQQPRYDPKDDAGVSRFTAPDSATIATFTDAGSVTGTLTTGHALVVCNDRLWLIRADKPANHQMKIYRYDGGTTWTLVVTYDTGSTTTENQHISACAFGTTIYIVTTKNTSAVAFYTVDVVTNTFAVVKKDVVYTSLPAVLGPAAIATNGLRFVIAMRTAEVSGADVVFLIGVSFGNFIVQPLSVLDQFGVTWGGATIFDHHDLTHNLTQGFVLQGRADNGGADYLQKVIRGDDGLSWEELTNLDGVVTQPAVSTFSGSGNRGAVALDGEQIFFLRTRAATKDGLATAIHQSWFDGMTWHLNNVANGADAVNVASQPLSIVNWRGTMFYSYIISGTATIRIRRCNELTTTDTGYRRVLTLNEPNYVDGPEDDTQTALFVTPRGRIREGDSFTIPPYYDYAASNVLVEALGEPYRTADNATPNVVMNAGTGRRFNANAIAYWGTNVPALTHQFHTSDSWGAPAQSLSLSALKYTLTVASANGDRVLFTTSPFQKDELAIRPNWANLSTGIFRIIANGTNWILVDGNPGSPSTGAGGATIFGDRMAIFPGSELVYQYARTLYPSALQVPALPDGSVDSYQIEGLHMGTYLQTNRNYAGGLTIPVEQPQTVAQLRGGRRIWKPTSTRQRRAYPMSFQLHTETQIAQWEGFYARTRGATTLSLFWPKGEVEPNNFLVGRIEGLELHRIQKLHYDASLNFVEDLP